MLFFIKDGNALYIVISPDHTVGHNRLDFQYLLQMERVCLLLAEHYSDMRNKL